VGPDGILQFELFSAARVGCGDVDRRDTIPATCHPIQTVRASLMHDRMSRAGERECGQIMAPGRDNPNRPPQRGTTHGPGKSQRWCALRAMSFVLPAVRNATHPRAAVQNRRGSEPGASGFQTGELFATLGTVSLPARTAPPGVPPLSYREGDNRYSYGRSWDSAAVYIGQDGSHRPTVRENGSFEPFISIYQHKCDHFTKTGSGQNQGKLSSKTVFSQVGTGRFDIGKKTGFLSHLCINTIFLPRQARDKHRENSKKARFLEVVRCEDDPYVLAAQATSLSMDFGAKLMRIF
jgi:hypothetical protein